MKNTAFWGAVLSGALAAAPVMAEDSAAFHAFSQMPSALSAIPEAQLASIQGGVNTQNCGSSGSGGGAVAVGVNAGNCSNVGAVVVVPVCAGVGVLLGTGSCAAQQPTTVVVTQCVQCVGNGL